MFENDKVFNVGICCQAICCDQQNQKLRERERVYEFYDKQTKKKTDEKISFNNEPYKMVIYSIQKKQ